MVKVAFYKGKTRFFNKAVAWWTRGPYSHCELIVSGHSYSSSFLDGGVRVKDIVYDPDHWDIVDVPWANAEKAVEWFQDHMGQGYDVVGLVGFVARRVEDDRNKYFCSEAVAASLGLADAWRFDPNTLYPVLALMA